MKSEYFQESPLAIHPSMFPTWWVFLVIHGIQKYSNAGHYYRPAKSELGGKKPASKTGASPKAPAGKSFDAQVGVVNISEF